MSFLFLLLTSLPAQTASAAEEVHIASAAKAPPLSDIQNCLDEMRRSDIEKKRSEGALAPNGTRVAGVYSFTQVPPNTLPASCPSGDLFAMKEALRNQILACGKPSPKAAPTARFGCRSVRREEWCSATNQKMLKIAEGSKNFTAYMDAIKNEFDWYRSDGRLEGDHSGEHKKGEFQFTGYDTPPAIEASLKPNAEFKYPIYKRPPDLIEVDADSPKNCGADPVSAKVYSACLMKPDGSLGLVPNRREINSAGALKNENLIIGYVKDPVDLAFLMIEGSGSISVKTPEGQRVVRLNYAGQNGRSRFLLGRIIKCDGGSKADFGSESGIRKYLLKHSDRATNLMNYDQSYVFFRPDAKGPFGANGIPITARHSFATDPTVLPLGTVSLFNVKAPVGKDPNCHEMTSVAISQDAGGAVNGAHADWYTGDGEQARDAANALNAGGSLFVALPHGAGEKIANCNAGK